MQNVHQRQNGLFRFKTWLLCGSDGYPYNRKIYQVKEKNTQYQTLGSGEINNTIRRDHCQLVSFAA